MKYLLGFLVSFVLGIATAGAAFFFNPLTDEAGQPATAGATTRVERGLRCSTKRLMLPPLPAASRPSKMIATRSPRLAI